MKKNIFLLQYITSLFLLLSMLNLFYVFAQENIDWSNHELMDQDDFIKNLEKDPSGGFSADSSRAWQTIETDPDLMRDENILDSAFNHDSKNAASMINKEPSLLDDSNVIERFDIEAQNDIFLLNYNPEAKKKWFSVKGVRDEGATLESYDGSVVKTEGDGATTFSFDDLQYHDTEAIVRENGKLVLLNDDGSEGPRISNGILDITPDGTLVVEGTGSLIDLSDSKNVKGLIDGGIVQIGDRIFSSENEPFHISIDSEKETIIGSDIVEAEMMPDGSFETKSSFSGIVTTYSSEHKTLGMGTEYSEYKNGEISKTYTVSQLTEYHTGSTQCSGELSCIRLDDEQLRVIAMESEYGTPNNMDIRIHDDSVSFLEVDEIYDDSTVSFRKGAGELVFSDGPFSVNGVVSSMDLGLSTYFEGENYIFGSITPAQGERSISKDQFMTGMRYLLDQGYTIHDIAFAYHIEHYTTLDYYGGVLSGILSPLAISEGPQGRHYQDPQLVEHIKTFFPSGTPFIEDEGGVDYKISHTFAGIAAAANTNSLWGRFRTWANSEGGDLGQVVVYSGQNFLGGNFEIASEYRSRPEVRANKIGMRLAPEFASNHDDLNRDSSYVLPLLEEHLRQITLAETESDDCRNFLTSRDSFLTRDYIDYCGT